MKIEQVKLLRTLKAGADVWVEGSYFPNKDYPSIPHEILMEVKHQTGRVEVTKQSPDVVLPKKAVASEKEELTSTSVDVETKLTGRASLEEARQREKAEIESAELPKRKSKLVRR